ncbi:MAG: Ig-like domain-containing protein [Treponema sp.]|nr:Ig-like domain-containing protein [Treponema sp.]
MKRVGIITAVVMALSVLFFGCDTGGDDGDSTVKVTKVTISGTGVASGVVTIAVDGTLQLTATVEPDKATNKTVTWSSDKPNIVSVNAGLVKGEAAGEAVITATAGGVSGRVTITVAAPAKVESVAISGGTTVAVEETLSLTAEVSPTNVTNEDKVITWTTSDATIAEVSEAGVVTGKTAGSVTITATTAGLKADGNPATATVSLTVTAPVQANLVVFNQSASPTTGTTTALPELNAQGRYVINNANPEAAFASDGLPNSKWKDNVLVYLDTPIEGDFTMDARLNITKFNETGASIDGAWSGAWIGAFNAPTMTDFGTAPVDSWGFVGARKVYSGDDRMLITRNNSTGSGTTYPTGRLYASNSWEYEYLYTISRAGTTYTIQVKNSKTGAVLAEGTRSAGSDSGSTSAYTDSLKGAVYLGVMITSCEIEISSFKVTQGENIVYQQTPTDHGPTPVAATAVALSVTAVEGGSGFDYLAPLANVPDEGIQINAAFTPANATDDLQWSITGSGTVSQVGLVTITAPGEYTVTATASPSNIATEYKIKILDAVPDVTSVTISGPDEVNVNSTITLTATVEPVGADATIDWSSSNGSIATVNADTGVVTGVGQGTVTITATSFSGVDGAEVKGEHTVTVIAPKEGVFFSWNAETDDELATIASGGTRQIGDVPVVAVARVVTAVTEGTKGYAVGNGRFVIGSTSTTETKADDTTTAGVFDLSVPFKITIVYASMKRPENDTNNLAFQVYLNNNSSNEHRSAIGKPSSDTGSYTDRIWNGTEVEDGDTIVIEVDPSVYPRNPEALKTGFISLRADSHTIALITSITLEYITAE